MSSKENNKNVTLSINKDVHLQFKMETTRNSADMSLTVETFMSNYSSMSIELNEDRKAKNLQDERTEG